MSIDEQGACSEIVCSHLIQNKSTVYRHFVAFLFYDDCHGLWKFIKYLKWIVRIYNIFLFSDNHSDYSYVIFNFETVKFNLSLYYFE